MTPPAVIRLLQSFDHRASSADAREPGDQADVLEAMKAALAERTDGSPMHELALVLVRSGVVDPGTTACLEPWRQSPFLWKQRAFTGAKISDFLLRHGFRPMTPAGAALIDGAVADPVPAIEDPAPLWAALFGRQLVQCTVDAEAGAPRADRLFADLAVAGRPPVALDSVRQILEHGQWRVTFQCFGQRHAFSVAHFGSRLDVDSVVSAFNALMAHLAHPCRAFQIDRPMPPEGGVNATAHLIVTRADRFEAAARALAIPLAASRPD